MIDTNNIGKFLGIYRGFVVWNKDPLNKGRIKIAIPGVYPDQFNSIESADDLPWATPAMSSFGGRSTRKW